MRVEIIASGTELIRGRSLDTNSPYLSRRLNRLGFEVRSFSCFGDDLGDLVSGLRASLKRSDLVILTGGLGPTVDDLSRHAAAKATGRRLSLDRAEQARLEARFKKLDAAMPAINKRQAYFPKGAVVLPNSVGSASGFLIEHRRRFLAVLPGPPREMEAMLDSLLERIPRPAECPWIDKAFKIAGVSESRVESEVYPEIRRYANVHYGITAKGGIISVNVRVRSPGASETIDRLRGIVKKKLGAAFFGEDEDTIAGKTAELLLKSGRSLAVAESCTGGEIASRLTDIPGVSASLIEAVVTYSNESKVSRLGVRSATLRKFGAVSESVAKEMASGARRTAGADLGAATTGVAGPTGGSDDKPVGLVFMAVATPRGTAVQKKVFGGNRLEIKARASDYTLDMIRRALLDEA